jgi:hypothetical protein
MSGFMEYGLWKSSKSFPHIFHTNSTAFPQGKVDIKSFISWLSGECAEFSTFPWHLDFSF